MLGSHYDNVDFSPILWEIYRSLGPQRCTGILDASRIQQNIFRNVNELMLIIVEDISVNLNLLTSTT